MQPPYESNNIVFYDITPKQIKIQNPRSNQTITMIEKPDFLGTSKNISPGLEGYELLYTDKPTLLK
jgi:hypothetical protein